MRAPLNKSRRDDLKELWVPLSGAIAQQRKVETIANNVANANTPGFKKDQIVFKEYLTQFEKGYEQDLDLPHKEWKPEDFYRSYGAEHAKVKVDGSFTDFQQGQTTPTGNPLDVALKGKGFIEVLTPNGVRYTRKGNLSINPAGLLVTDGGNPVLSKIDPALLLAGENLPSPQERTIQLPQNSGRLAINFQGELSNSNGKISDLSIVEFNDIHALKKEGNSFYINEKFENISTAENKTAVYQGFIEQSNVNAIQEMSELIKANRNFESIQRVIKTYDTISGKGVNEIAKF
ncbi:putative flagellar basal-body rod protein [Halobacteriovorax marinus SJ]|uniref:Flagellar basal-body rod protein n=1 Tax=Halobacteriovorax marinus (strain ATCC BAA-682 / DSM 15412 / SJ) TaxID=862908 RepID=E1X124_HALMS|nr:putative flagellar basal-body rod protein [Halobacteriovorax marinus SJ]